MSYAGRKDGGPVPLPLQIADVASGSNNAIIAILAAVIHRQKTGKGQHLDISMTDGVFAFNALAAAACLATAEIPEREGFILNGGSLYDFYETADNQYIGFGGMEPQFFTAFCQAIQAASPVDSFVRPEPWDMPGYDCPVIMAAGTFVQGSSIELAADAPLRPPFTAYMQGGLCFENIRLACMLALEKMGAGGL